MNSDFIPLPAKIGMVSLEMGLNWQIAIGCKQYLMFHAGVVAKDGVGLIMPAMSGSGKSTLAAGLAIEGGNSIPMNLACLIWIVVNWCLTQGQYL